MKKRMTMRRGLRPATEKAPQGAEPVLVVHKAREQEGSITLDYDWSDLMERAEDWPILTHRHVSEEDRPIPRMLSATGGAWRDSGAYTLGELVTMVCAYDTFMRSLDAYFTTPVPPRMRDIRKALRCLTEAQERRLHIPDITAESVGHADFYMAASVVITRLAALHDVCFRWDQRLVRWVLLAVGVY